MKAWILIIIFSTGVLAGCANQVPAELRSDRIWGIFPNLDQKDREIMQHIARDELTGKPVGTELSWSNPDSGAHGTVELLHTSIVNGMQCRDVRHIVKTRSEPPQGYIFEICELSTGVWKVVNLKQIDTDPQ